MNQGLPQEDIVAAVLVGGQSRRMGQPKTQVTLPDGRTLLDVVLATLFSSCPAVVLVGGPMSLSTTFCHQLTEALPDAYPGEGPLGGVITVLQSGLAQRYVIVSCDQPGLSENLFTTLIQADAALSPSAAVVLFESTMGSKLQPFPGIYHVSALPQLQTAFEHGERAMHRALCCTLPPEQMHEVPLAKTFVSQLESLNTPSDLAAWVAGSYTPA
jgi:molybdopterin-guanine dinucleotide biosynthesis protein A